MKLPAKVCSGQEPSLVERAADREWIGGRALTLLSHYWIPDDPVELTAAIGADWAEVLHGFSRERIHSACIEYQKREPRRKPTPGSIYQIIVGKFEKYSDDDLSGPQKTLLLAGSTPPSMACDDGTPNAKARYWLNQYHGSAA